MNLTEYTHAATRTESRIDNVTIDATKLTIVANLFIHAGNMLDMIKKNAFYGKKIKAYRVVCRRTSTGWKTETSDVLRWFKPSMLCGDSG